MKISRVFRKYNRILLLVFMSLLLVVFLVGDVIGRSVRGRQARDVEIGTVFGETVYLSQTFRAQDDFEVAARFGVRSPFAGIEDPQQRNLAMFLAAEEAYRAGIRIDRDEIVGAFRNAPSTSAMLNAMRKSTGRSLDSIYDSMARVTATMTLAQYQLRSATGASLPQLEQAYRDASQEARVLISVIDSHAFLPQVPPLTDEELQAHFDEGKDRDTEHVDETLAFGYRIPDRVQVEYLTVDPAEIQDTIRVSEKKALRHYEDHRSEYTTKVVDGPSPSGLENARSQEVQLTYEEVAERVKEDYRAEKAILEAQRLVNEIQQEAQRPWTAAPVDEDGVRQAPPEDAIASFTELREKYSAEYPVTYKKTDLVSDSELRLEPNFGRASAVLQRRPVPASVLAFRVEGLATANPDDPDPVLQVNEPGPVVLEGRGIGTSAGQTAYQAYVFRVIRVAPSGPPESLDEVREELVENVKQCRAFELAGQQARVLVDQALQVGLEQAVAEATELKALLGEAEEPAASAPTALDQVSGTYTYQLEPFEPEHFSREAQRLRAVGFAPGLHEQVFARAEEAGDDPGGTHRIIVIPLAKKLKWALVELLEIKPIYRGEFEMQRAELEQQVTWMQGSAFYVAWFNPDNIVRRVGFVPVAPSEP